MYNFKESILNHLSIHFVGNAADNEGMTLSKSSMKVDDEIKDLLKKFFLKPFKEGTLYNFEHSSDLNLNEMYAYASAVFADPDSLHLQSVNMARHLYDSSQHPMIKSGEVYIAYLDECVIEGEVCEVLGVFKSENKETYLKVFPHNDEFEVSQENGININKLDKGCLIFNTEKEHGYKVAIVDNSSKGEEAARFWKDDFLAVAPREDSFYHTQNYIDMCKGFAHEALGETSRVDQIDLMNNSMAYFKETETFNKQEFAEKVMQEPEVIEAFEQYKNQYTEDRQVTVYDEFDISKPAVKQSKKFVKSVIKLDKNFHVYVHGNRENVERGYDEGRQQNFYTLYFYEES